jgi:hypothetical protein
MEPFREIEGRSMAVPLRDGILGAVRLVALASLGAPSAGGAAARAAWVLWLSAGFAGAAPPARAGEPPWQVGETIAPFELADQHGELASVDSRVRLLIFAADMDGGDLANRAIEPDPSLHDLPAHSAVFVSDVSRMPAVITRLFARPSMRRRPYRMLLDTGPGPTVRIPRRAGKVTLVGLDALAVRSIAFADSPEAVAQALRAGAPAEP